MAWACGIAEEIREPPSVVGGSAIRFLTPPPGIVEAVVGVGTARSRPGIVDVEVGVGPGDRLPEIRDAWDRSGHVLAVGADAMSAAERCEDALECIDVRYRASERSSD
jgi:hypothetical protein